MIRIAIVTTHPIQYNAPFFKALAESGTFQIKVFYTWEKSEKPNYDEGFKKTIAWDIPLLQGYDYTFVKNTSKIQDSKHFFRIKNPTLNREIKSWNADAILIYGWNFHSHLIAMMHFKGNTPILFRGDSTLLNEKNNVKTLIRRIILTCVYRFVDIALYVGTQNKKYYQKHGLSENKLLFVPHAVDNQRFENKEQKINYQLRKQLGIEENKIIFLFAGKFEKRKNPQILIESYISLPDSLKQKAVFILVGNGELENELKKKSQTEQGILFLPFQNQSKMPQIYQLADVFVLPSISETWGLAINEAMNCGLAILASNRVGCATDLVMNNNTGFIFEFDQPEELTNKMKTLIQNPDVLSEMKKNSLNCIKSWSYEKGIEMLSNKLTIKEKQ